MSTSNIFFPQVSRLPESTPSPQRENQKVAGTVSEFDRELDLKLSQVREPLKFSAHATQRLKERNIAMDPAMMTKVNDAVDKARGKGVEEGLVITADAAFVVSMKNKTVITALDRSALNGNVFTNIDGVVMV